MARRFFLSHDRAALRELEGRPRPFALDRVVSKAIRLSPREERKALLYHRDLPAPSALPHPDPDIDDDVLAAVVRIQLSRPRWEAAWHFLGDIRVAPGRPFVFVNNRLVAGSTGINEDAPGAAWRNYARMAARRPVLRIERGILLRDTWEDNYWHLLQDILPRLAMANEIGIDDEVPIIVSGRLMKAYGDRLARTSVLSQRPLVIQPEGQTLRCKELFLLQPASFPSHRMEAISGWIDKTDLQTPNARFIYCRRAATTSNGRTTENAEETEALFRKAGFAIVDPASLGIGEQKAIFEQAEAIAGINGAAFANAVFRHGRRLSIGAFMSPNWLSSTFPAMAKVYGFDYSSFSVNPTGDDPRSELHIPRDTALRLIARLLSQAAANSGR
jgi:hypothetical protein